MTKKNMLRIFGLAVGTALCLCACSPEEYGPCSIPDTSAHCAACKPQGDSKTATCTADYVFDCDSMICGRFDNSAAFCTYRCNPTAEECNSTNPDNCKWADSVKAKDKCPDGAACVEWTPGTGAYYCLPQEKGCSANYKNYTSDDPFCSDYGKGAKPTSDTKPYDIGHDCVTPSDCKSNNCGEGHKCAEAES